MNVRPFPPREPYDREEDDYSGVIDGWWMGLCLTCGCSGFVVGVVIIGLAWWLA